MPSIHLANSDRIYLRKEVKGKHFFPDNVCCYSIERNKSTKNIETFEIIK